MNKKIIIICLILKSSLYSQFYDINLSYEYNNLSIKDEHKYILEEWIKDNQFVKFLIRVIYLKKVFIIWQKS